MNTPKPTILPGDHLIYGSSGDLISLAISVKTWSPAVHIEIYAGGMQSVASRNGIGVNLYPYRDKQLIAILRPNIPFNFAKGMNWFYSEAKGQGYDWLGLFCFTLAVKQGSPNKMFCSEFATRFDRECGLHSFHPNWDADKVAPGSFLMSPAFDWVWKDESWS